MIYNCYKCNSYSFEEVCNRCGEDYIDSYVPLDPFFYPEFKYKSQGIIKDLLLKKKTQKHLNEKLDMVLEKYHKLKNPYFINYLHIARKNFGFDLSIQNENQTYPNLDLFHMVLTRLGFDELNEYQHLTEKLIRSTEFNFHYSNFANQINSHIKENLSKSLYSWVEEKGSLFRAEIHLFIYYLWENKKFFNEIAFKDTQSQKRFIPLVSNEDLEIIFRLCEKIYLDIQIVRFKTKLEKFDPEKYITIYKIDSMNGYEFEDFLIGLFAVLGYDIKKTKKSHDQGADLFASKFEKKIVIQAKNYSDNVGNSAIQQVLSAKNFYECDEAMVITNRYFTPSARELANAVNIKLIDRNKLKEYLDEYNQMIIESSGQTQNNKTTNHSNA